jgi:hypothetical protein
VTPPPTCQALADRLARPGLALGFGVGFGLGLLLGIVLTEALLLAARA